MYDITKILNKKSKSLQIFENIYMSRVEFELAFVYLRFYLKEKDLDLIQHIIMKSYICYFASDLNVEQDKSIYAYTNYAKI